MSNHIGRKSTVFQLNVRQYAWKHSVFYFVRIMLLQLHIKGHIHNRHQLNLIDQNLSLSIRHLVSVFVIPNLLRIGSLNQSWKFGFWRCKEIYINIKPCSKNWAKSVDRLFKWMNLLLIHIIQIWLIDNKCGNFGLQNKHIQVPSHCSVKIHVFSNAKNINYYDYIHTKRFVRNNWKHQFFQFIIFFEFSDKMSGNYKQPKPA